MDNGRYFVATVIFIITIFILLIIYIIKLRDKFKRKINEKKNFSFSYNDINLKTRSSLIENLDIENNFSKNSKIETGNLFKIDDIINNLDIGLAFVTEYNIIFKTNKYLEQIFYPTEIVGQNIDELLERLAFLDKHDSKHKPLSNFEDKLYLKINEQIKYFSLRKIPLIPNKITMIVIYDKSELIQLEQEIKQLKNLSLLKVIAGSLAHDLNNQLGIILTHTERILLKIDRELPKEVLRTIEIIKRTCLRARTLTQELLIFGKQLNPTWDLIPVKEFLIELAEFTFSGTKISTNYTFDPRIQMIMADKNLLEIAIHNIFLNAKQAMGDKGSIFISIDYKSPYIEIKIRDTGPGIPSEIKNKLFTPFVTTKPKGTGLGLYSVKKILEAHGGKVDLESSPGEGTTIKLYLPEKKIFEENIGPTQTCEPISLKSKKLKILYMDDDRDILDAIKELFESFQHEIVTCENGEEAIKLYEMQGPFDIFIFDLSVPGKFDGLQTLREVRKIDPDVKAILATGDISIKKQEDLKNLKIDAIVIKPFTIETLFNKIDSILP